MYTIHHPSDPPCRQLRSQFVSKLMLKSGWRNLQKAPDAADRFSQPRRTANISMSTNGRWRASGRPWVHLIAGKASRTNRSKHGSIPGAASASGPLPNDRRNEHRLVAGSDRRPGFSACLYCGRQSRCRPPDRAAHHREHRAINPKQSTDRPRRTGAGHARTCHSQVILHRPLSPSANENPDLARLSCSATLA